MEADFYEEAAKLVHDKLRDARDKKALVGIDLVLNDEKRLPRFDDSGISVPLARDDETATVWKVALEREASSLLSALNVEDYEAAATRLSPGVAAHELDGEDVVAKLVCIPLGLGVFDGDIDEVEKRIRHGLASVSKVPRHSILGRRVVRSGDDWRQAPSWLYENLFLSVSTATIIGKPGSGKTALALELARSLATGEPFLGIVPEMLGSTIVVACEAISTLPQRLAAVTPEGTKLPITCLEASNLRSREAMDLLLRDLQSAADEMLAAFEMPLRLIVLDTLRASGLAKENDNDEMANVAKILAAWASRFSVLAIAIHHPKKNDESVEAGGGALKAGVDAQLVIMKTPGKSTRRVFLDKSRHAEERELNGFRVKRVELGLDNKGKMMTTVRVEALSVIASGPTDFDVFMTCLQNASSSPVPRLALRAAFAGQKSGSRDKAEVTRVFDRCLTYAEEHGLVAVVEDGQMELVVRPLSKYQPPAAATLGA
jgi:hypothetical protein